MLRLLTDENFDNNIVRGVVRRIPDLDILRVQDVGLSGIADPIILEWAAKENRILLTHDVSTVTDYAYARVRAGKYMPGVIEVKLKAHLGVVIEELCLLILGSNDGEWENLVVYVPL